jgi:ATP-dependent DNA helicase RecQ
LCVSIDLEVDPKTNRLQSFAAVRADAGKAFVHSRGDLAQALAGLDAYADAADFVLGHNIIQFDVRHLEAARSDLRLLKKPAVDTLWLNPLAFPRNLYYHLVKHYHDGRLQAGHANDPEPDAKFVLTVLENQLSALDELGYDAPDTLVAYHYLTKVEDHAAGFDAVFSHVRGMARPRSADARATIRQIVDGEAWWSAAYSVPRLP